MSKICACMTVFKRIFEYFPPNIGIRIRFVEAEYYSNIRIFCPNISEYWSLIIRENTEIKEVLFYLYSNI